MKRESPSKRLAHYRSYKAAGPSSAPARSSLLNVPNLITLSRALMIITAEFILLFQQHPSSKLQAFKLYSISLSLDALDGMAARFLKQETQLGAFFDVAVDNLSRMLLWNRATVVYGGGILGCLVPMIEALVFTITSSTRAKNWKADCFREAPSWVSLVMTNNFRTWLGSWTIAGLFALPLWLFGRNELRDELGHVHPFIWMLLGSPIVGLILLSGRCISLGVEGWIIWNYIIQVKNQ
jgi:phosphatidylglycerophosphate synthase